MKLIKGNLNKLGKFSSYNCTLDEGFNEKEQKELLKICKRAIENSNLEYENIEQLELTIDLRFNILES